MNREIEFRGIWQDGSPNGMWVYGLLRKVIRRIDGKVFVQYVIDEAREDDHWSGIVDIKTVGQYTGLKDKNGVKVFEGDILTIGDKNILYVVTWLDTGLKGKQIGNMSCIGLIFWQNELEVIGNVHEHSHLLEEEA